MLQISLTLLRIPSELLKPAKFKVIGSSSKVLKLKVWICVAVNTGVAMTDNGESKPVENADNNISLLFFMTNSRNRKVLKVKPVHPDIAA